MVHSPYIPSQLLACKTLGARHPRFATDPFASRTKYLLFLCCTRILPRPPQSPACRPRPPATQRRSRDDGRCRRVPGVAQSLRDASTRGRRGRARARAQRVHYSNRPKQPRGKRPPCPCIRRGGTPAACPARRGPAMITCDGPLRAVSLYIPSFSLLFFPTWTAACGSADAIYLLHHTQHTTHTWPRCVLVRCKLIKGSTDRYRDAFVLLFICR